VWDGLDLLGYRVFPDFRLLRNDNGHRFARALRRMADAYEAGRLEWHELNPRVQSWIGHARQADSWGLRKAIFSRTVFRRGRDQEVSGASAAARGTTNRGTPARRTATGTPPATGTTTSVCASPSLPAIAGVAPR